MKQKKTEKITKEKKIRRLLLLKSDNEMQKKIRKKNPVLINSLTPLELENLYQLYNVPINTSTSYTNILEKHIVKQIVDVPKNINYFYSDLLDDKKRNKNKLIKNYRGLYSAKNFVIDYDNYFDNDEEEKEFEKENEDELIEHLMPISFISKKKSVGEEKIKGSRSFSVVYQKNIIKNKKEDNKIKNDNNIINSNCNCNCNSNNNQSCIKYDDKHINKKKMLDINYKLIYYCYTNLKRKRPLMIQKNNDNDITIYGLEIEEEYFNKIKIRASTIKKGKSKKKIQYNKIRSKSSKNINGMIKKQTEKEKKRENNLNSKDLNKKRRGKSVTNRNHHKYHHIHNNNNDIEQSNLKSKVKKLISVKSERKHKFGNKRFSQGIKSRTNSIVKKHYYTNNIGESPFQNIISKADTKTSSFDNICSYEDSFTENKNRNKFNNNIFLKKKDLNSNSKNKEKTKSVKKDKNCMCRRKFKFITHNKLKHECPEEMKIKESNQLKPNKKSLKEPIRAQFMNSLQKKVGFNFEENKKNFYKNKASSKLSLINRIKSKSKKNCLEYDNYSNDNDDDLFYFNKKLYSNKIKEKKLFGFVHLRKFNTINKKRKLSYNKNK